MSRESLFDHLPKCGPDTPQGTVARIRVGHLRPTQNAVGMDEVNTKVARMGQRSDSSLQASLMERAIPVVIGDEGRCHLIDHHHLAVSVLAAEGDIDVPVEVVRNWAPVKGTHFWKAMARQHWMYPFAADGGGPIPIARMAEHLGDLGNDIYRSVSWLARSHYAYVKSPDNAIFAEFRWANFFRTHLVLEQLLDCTGDCEAITLADLQKSDPDSMEDARLRVVYLARSPEARTLPGYVG